LQKVWASPVQEDIAAGDRGRHGIGPRLDAVGKDGMLGAVESLSPLDPQGPAADPLDPGAHLHQAVGDIDDLGLARGVLDQRLAAGKHGGHQGIMGRANRDLGKRNAVAGQAPGGFGDHVAAFELDFGSERLERGEMQIDGARADGATARQRDLRPAAARQQGRQHPEARPHARHHLVGRRGVDDVRCGEPEGLAVAGALARLLAGDGDVNPVIAQNAGKHVDVGEARNIVQRQGLAGEKAGNHQRQRSVLGATDRNGAAQALAADNADAVHGFPSLATGRRSVVCYRRPARLRIGLGGARLLVLTSEASGEVPPAPRAKALCDQLAP